MDRDQKAVRYDQIVAQGDVLQRELSKLKSANAEYNTKSQEYDEKVADITNKLNRLEAEMRQLFVDY